MLQEILDTLSFQCHPVNLLLLSGYVKLFGSFWKKERCLYLVKGILLLWHFVKPVRRQEMRRGNDVRFCYFLDTWGTTLLGNVCIRSSLKEICWCYSNKCLPCDLCNYSSYFRLDFSIMLTKRMREERTTLKEELEDKIQYLAGRWALTPGETMELQQLREKLELLESEEE